MAASAGFMSCVFLSWLAAALLALAQASVCPAGTEVRYFYGGSAITVGTPVMGKISCDWGLDPSTPPFTCPFYMRIDTSSTTDLTQMKFNAVPLFRWPCSRYSIGGFPHYCWYTSTVTYGPDTDDKYRTTDGSMTPSYMVFAGFNGNGGPCNAKAATCTSSAYACADDHALRNGVVAGPTGCQAQFCDVTSFQQGCCAAKCSAGYGHHVGACPSGTYSGSNTNTCADFTCSLLDQATCCKRTSPCLPNNAVEVFGNIDANTDYILIVDPVQNVQGNVQGDVTGKVSCRWPDKSTPPSRCHYYPRTSSEHLLFSSVPSGTVNCAREGGTGTRYCWSSARVKQGPNVFDQYQMEGGTRWIEWYKVHQQTATGYTACSKGDINCGTRVYSCAAAITGGQPKPGIQLGDCQSTFCHMKTFAAGCCTSPFATTRTTTTSTTTTSTTLTTSSTTTVTTTTTTSTTTTSTTSTTSSTTTVTTTTTTSTTTTSTTSTSTTSTTSSTTSTSTTSTATTTTITSTTTTTTRALCSAGSPVRYFYGGKDIVFGNIGILKCSWPVSMDGSMRIKPIDCPFYLKFSHGGYSSVPDQQWDCSMSNRHSYCWYSSYIEDGPNHNEYTTRDGSKTAWYMVFDTRDQTGAPCPLGNIPPSRRRTTTSRSSTSFLSTSPIMTTTQTGSRRQGVPCPAGSGVLFFFAGGFQYIGNPVLGRLHCLWPGPGQPYSLPATCPFEQRIGSVGGNNVNLMRFTTTGSNWTCGVNSNQCWYTSKIVSGPALDPNDPYGQSKYTMEGGFQVYWYMTHLITDGTAGSCSAGLQQQPR